MVRRQVSVLPTFAVVASLGSVGGGTLAGASGSEVQLAARLAGTNVLPPADPDGTGVATFQVDAGVGQLCFRITVVDTATPNRAAIHAGTVGSNGGIVVELFNLIGAPADPRNDRLEHDGSLEGCVPATPDLLDSIAASPAQYYANVFNARFRGGAVRGQLDDDVASAPPMVGAPEADFRNVAIGMSSTPVPLTIDFSASDPNGIATTRLQQKVGTGAFTDVPLAAGDATSANVGVAASDSVVRQFRARATDGASPANTSRYALGPPLKIRAFQNGNGAVVQGGTWTSQSNSAFFGGSVRYSSSATASQRLSLSTSDLAVVSTKGPDRGIVRVYVDGVLHASVDLYRATTKHRLVVFSVDFGSSGSHTIEMRPADDKNPASTDTRVDFDAFLAVTP